MHVAVVGMNHRTAPVELRERLAVPEEQLVALLPVHMSGNGSHPDECVILSTCNRFEYYTVVSTPEEALTRFMELSHTLGAFEEVDVRAHLYHYVDGEAVRHLFRVASGLDSMVLGEPQILGQVAHAYELAHNAGAVGPVLSRLFQQAIHVGKRARAETAIGRAHASVGSAAVQLLREHVSDLGQARALVVGAGKMARTAARYLRATGVARLTIVNRTHSRALALAEDVDAEVLRWEALSNALARADVVIVATGAPSYLVLPEHVPSREATHPLAIVDIGVPRNVHPAVADLPGVRVFDIDDLKGIVDDGLALRRSAVPQVEAIIARAVDGYMRWLQARAVAPTISALYERAEAIRRQTLERTLRRFSNGDITPEVLEEVTRILVDKLLQVPARNLQVLAREGDADGYDQAIKRLFELE